MPETPESQEPDPTDGLQPPADDRLLEQARAAANQAIELAKLAQESAKLAHSLNARALNQTGERLEDLPEVSVRRRSADPDLPDVDADSTPVKRRVPAPNADFESLAETDQPPSGFATTGADSRKPAARTKKRKTSKIEQHRKNRFTKQPAVEMPKKVKIKVDKTEKDPETVIAFVATNWKSWLGSGCLLSVAFLILASFILEFPVQASLNTVMASFGDEMVDVEEDLPTEQPMEEPGEQQEEDTEEVVEEPEPEPEPMEELTPEEPVETEMAEVDPVDINENSTAPPVSEAVAEALKTGSRNEMAKAALLQKYGGTPASESAVQFALEWFVRHQRADGSWNFTSDGVGASGNPGTVNNPIGATSFVLLSFLGAGQTHKSGKYKKNVAAGIDFIVRNGRMTAGMVDLSGVDNSDKKTHERFYVHGAAALVLTECYAMTKDRKLKQIAQGAITTIVRSQDQRGGGWEYTPLQPGTLSVTGWQTAALFGAKKSGLAVPPSSFKGIDFFLTSVQSHGDGSRYGYMAAKATTTNTYTRTAIGLFCRMYRGWNRSTPDLVKGIELIKKTGPRTENLYYTYYATQVMKQWGGPDWEEWNNVVRDELVGKQEQNGDVKGSWTPQNGRLESSGGGRLFATCLSTMTLEVYYRYLPLYDTIGETKEPQGEDVADTATSDESGDGPAATADKKPSAKSKSKSKSESRATKTK